MLIFNFHHVEAHPRQDPQDPDRAYVTITPDGLRNYIRLIRRCGWEIIPFADALKNPFGPGWQKQVIVTFDDGYVNNLTEALPVLAEEQCPATIFVLTGLPGGRNYWDQAHLPEAERDKLMTPEEMDQLAASPWIALGSHGHDHIHMPQTPPDVLSGMVQSSYDYLADRYPESFIPVFAYPWGEYDDNVLNVMRNTPFRAAVTTVKGAWSSGSPAFEIPRYSVYGRDANPWVAFGKWVRNGLVGPGELLKAATGRRP
ncbi:MAG: polysaccharide deacetylase family protein [Candidatus Melainabacteria bacterium]